ncbi:hypothetical protein WICPIJ_005673 [Wickerhamomyces pijperi]|uniref:Uncharacterized protein n=1 Tax=Wickerhamomyces pijperi TaxID=599730 RepID=A0A9P8Q5G6_WICPI|nr:hypothetical protein WICPIJ_005673 [Wickerhamomyces pijperi]
MISSDFLLAIEFFKCPLSSNSKEVEAVSKMEISPINKPKISSTLACQDMSTSLVKLTHSLELMSFMKQPCSALRPIFELLEPIHLSRNSWSRPLITQIILFGSADNLLKISINLEDGIAAAGSVTIGVKVPS